MIQHCQRCGAALPLDDVKTGPAAVRCTSCGKRHVGFAYSGKLRVDWSSRLQAKLRISRDRNVFFIQALLVIMIAVAVVAWIKER